MAVNVPRAQYDNTVHDNGEGLLQLPWFSDQYQAFYLNRGLSVPTALQSVDWRTNPTVDDQLAVNDMTFAPTVNLRTGATVYTINPRAGVEMQIRSKLAQIGFKPDANSFVKGGLLHNLTFSRVQDLEGLNAYRGEPFTTQPLVTSHVVPYVMFQWTPPTTGPYNIPAVLGITNINGYFLPQPWPRVLNAITIWRNTGTGPQGGWTKWWPRGAVFAGATNSGPDYQAMQTDGTFFLDRLKDPLITPANNVVQLQGGMAHQVWIGHVESLPGQFPHQRWPGPTGAGYTWKPGDGITY